MIRLIPPKLAALAALLLAAPGNAQAPPDLSGFWNSAPGGANYEMVHGRYDDTYTVSFAGFAPADQPRFTVYVLVQNPRNGGGGTGTFPSAPPVAGAPSPAPPPV